MKNGEEKLSTQRFKITKLKKEKMRAKNEPERLTVSQKAKDISQTQESNRSRRQGAESVLEY